MCAHGTCSAPGEKIRGHVKRQTLDIQTSGWHKYSPCVLGVVHVGEIWTLHWTDFFSNARWEQTLMLSSVKVPQLRIIVSEFNLLHHCHKEPSASNKPVVQKCALPLSSCGWPSLFKKFQITNPEHLFKKSYVPQWFRHKLWKMSGKLGFLEFAFSRI